VLTGIAAATVLSGLKRGIKYFAIFTFLMSFLLIFTLLFTDNTWYLLNVRPYCVGVTMFSLSPHHFLKQVRKARAN
jgi:choline-glycine betaine transporter